MLETFIYTTSQNILVGILTRIMAALKRFGGHSDGSGDRTQETLSQEPMGGVELRHRFTHD